LYEIESIPQNRTPVNQGAIKKSDFLIKKSVNVKKKYYIGIRAASLAASMLEIYSLTGRGPSAAPSVIK